MKRRTGLLLLFAMLWLAVPASGATSSFLPPTDRLEVIRFLVPYPPYLHVPPGKWTVDEAATQHLEKVIFALPPPPEGTRFCPLDKGVRYRLTFFYKGSQSFQVIAEAGACRVLYVDNSSNRQSDDDFWQTLGEVLHLPVRGGIFVEPTLNP